MKLKTFLESLISRNGQNKAGFPLAEKTYENFLSEKYLMLISTQVCAPHLPFRK